MKIINEMEWRTLFVERVRYYMQLYDINQAQLAESIGVSRAAMSKYLSCKRTPRIDVIVRMAIRFGCSVDELTIFSYVAMDKEE